MTLNFIVSSIDNQEVVADLMDKNARLSIGKKELKSILEIRDSKIKGLEQQLKIHYIWRSVIMTTKLPMN